MAAHYKPIESLQGLGVRRQAKRDAAFGKMFRRLSPISKYCYHENRTTAFPSPGGEGEIIFRQETSF